MVAMDSKYLVVEFDREDGGGVGIVNSDWMTPRKRNCMWPPQKNSVKFNKLLTDGKHPEEDWIVCRIARVFYRTGTKCILLVII